MSVKRYIHPRNKYKNPPDYKKLTIMYPEFRKIAITDLTGKIRIDFQKKESLRVLTETLLRHDFDLHVSIPPDNLNPAITLRMNYILWIEDLMRHSKLKMDKITGIDIGTGAICIYALLLAKIYGCHMIGTEVDRKSVEYAEKCIRRNNLQDLIKIVTVNSNDRIFKDAVKRNEVYDFSMCNPPFFESKMDDEKVAKALPPRNASTGNEGELKIEGGEVAFVTKMVEESIDLKDQIKIYSTMIGRKADLIHLKKLIKSRNIENITWTEFCQGHITRWGLAWSFLSKNVVDLTTAPVIRKTGKSMVGSLKKDHKILITFPAKDQFSCMDNLISFLKATAVELNIKLEEVPIAKGTFEGWVCRITAEESTWQHTRRKRRLAQRQLTLKKLKGEDSECIEINPKVEETSDTVCVEKIDDAAGASENPSNKTLLVEKEGNEENCDEKMLDKRVPLLACKLCVEIESTNIEEVIIPDNICKIWMIFENGSGGLEALQSLRQYLINKLGVREKILCDSPKSVKKKRRKEKNNSGREGVSVLIEHSQSNDEKDAENS